jgi:4-hydroxybenzoate-CoA ligase
MSSATLNAAEWILRAGAERSDAVALRYRGTSTARDLSYGELRERVTRSAAALRAAGLHAERRVLVALPDLPELVEVFLGAMWGGAVPILANPGLRTADYRAFVDDFQPTLLVTTPDIAATLADVRVPILTADVDGGGTLRDVVDAASPLAAPAATHADDPAFWLLSSGTTGRPKGVVHLHRAIPCICSAYGREILGMAAADICHATSKIFFAYGLGASVYFPLAAGATVVLSPEAFVPARTWAIVARERPSILFSVPSVYRALLDAAPANAREALSSVRIAVSAGEAFPEPLFAEWQRRFGVEILDGVGSTEMLHVYASNRPGCVVPGTVGQPVPGYEVRLVADDGSDVPDGEVGMMRVRGGSLAERYWRRLDATRQAFQGEWYVSGDRAVRSADGSLRILGRADDLFKVSGQWVLPTDVEAVIASVPGVREAAVVAGDGAAGLLEVVACVVLDGAATTDEVERRVRATAAERLPRFKRPGRVVVLDALPRTATGKLQRKILRDQLA